MTKSIKRTTLPIVFATIAATLVLAGCGAASSPPPAPLKTASPVATPTPAAKSLEGAFDRGHMGAGERQLRGFSARRCAEIGDRFAADIAEQFRG